MKESKIQSQIITMLRSHSKVAWAYVTSAGYVKGLNGGKMFKIGVTGMSDIVGQMKDGRLIAIEVKVPGKKPTEIQMEFIANVNKYYGVGGWADSLETAKKIIDEA